MSTIPRKVFIQVDTTEEQENTKNARKTLKILQKGATDKENLIGRPVTEKNLFKKSKSETAVISSTPSSEPRRRKSSQDPTEKTHDKITEEDLTSEGEPSEGYWKTLAEKRRIALDVSLKENEELHDKVASLEEELNISRSMLEESRNLVELLTEIIQEQEGDANDSGLPNNLGINANISRPLIGSDSTSDDTADDTCDEGAITDDAISLEDNDPKSE
ncbi:geminin [Contarinia nasturtii]|uniref:geminin n=1 Tax=Contarinia nasturtii TaxID=265458 RepID=UPI0012D4795F|nr:geminin [Contarinia nasturtii]